MIWYAARWKNWRCVWRSWATPTARGAIKICKRGARLLAAIADQLGMSTTAQVARDVTRCLDMADPVALAAVVARLLRSGERSLLAVWDVDVTSP